MIFVLLLIFSLLSEVKWKLLSHVQLCDTMDYTVLGILQAKILEWVAFPFFSGFSQPRDWTQVSCIAGGFFSLLKGSYFYTERFGLVS